VGPRWSCRRILVALANGVAPSLVPGTTYRGTDPVTAGRTRRRRVRCRYCWRRAAVRWLGWSWSEVLALLRCGLGRRRLMSSAGPAHDLDNLNEGPLCARHGSNERVWGLALASESDLVHFLAIRCGGCSSQWAGSDRAHCPRCHATFDDAELFDAHRGEVRCASGRAMGLSRTKNGIWLRPARPVRRVS